MLDDDEANLQVEEDGELPEHVGPFTRGTCAGVRHGEHLGGDMTARSCCRLRKIVVYRQAAWPIMAAAVDAAWLGLMT